MKSEGIRRILRGKIWGFGEEGEKDQRKRKGSKRCKLPVRAFESVGGQPIVIDSIRGSHVWDMDGNEYLQPWLKRKMEQVLGLLVFFRTHLLKLSYWLLQALKWSNLLTQAHELALVFSTLLVHSLGRENYRAGSEVATLGLPDSPSVLKGATYEIVTAPTMTWKP
ncbi:hypothetical protein Cgig2_005569 [Carnegiea gigantea]|uniref:Uncharacterized protein n=1 Tax=Carnegiea gigantea TaxID=171969 RepID=A0A9Q1QPA9_9CARY|nr:hypothetical protein Cgig2_005569 [Carnegiea gigantea]